MSVVKTHETAEIWSEAVYSDCGNYRYRLTRRWDAAAGRVAFIMLNPSTANEKINDPTIARCEKRARLLGFGTLDVVNLFAFRATDPAALRSADDPVGPENDGYLLRAVAEADVVITAWGVHGQYRGRDVEIGPVLSAHPAKLHTLGLTRHGLPRHPLYVSYAQRPQPWTAGVLSVS